MRSEFELQKKESFYNSWTQILLKNNFISRLQEQFEVFVCERNKKKML